MGIMKAARCIVAHPDDCVIFARPYIDNHPEYTWGITYLTYHFNDPRAVEVSNYWHSRGIATQFLGYQDDYKDQQTGQFHFWDPMVAEESLRWSAAGCDLILTHNADGDYGHIHHKLVHGALCQLDIPKVYFASTFNYNVRYMATGDLPLDQFPLHRDVIEQFTDINCGLYIE
jgi:LmbE family N-acetylglucosaminyl deacetylase